MTTTVWFCPFCNQGLPTPETACPRCGDDRVVGRRYRNQEGAAGTLTSVSSALAPDRRYGLLATIGRGGSGAVYRVHDRELDEIVALKVLDASVAKDTAAVERFKQELKVARRINHPYVGRLYDLQIWRGSLAISQEYIHGRTLASMLTDGPLEVAALRRYLRYLCSALGSAHRLGVVHRDLKPANIVVDQDDRPHIIDFGIALLRGGRGTTADFVCGTPWYMSPEQTQVGAAIDQRADIYSLGMVLYQMATGEFPFSAHSLAEILRAHATAEPTPPSRHRADLPTALEDVIMRCLRKDPAERYPSARDVHADLEQRLRGSGLGTPMTRPGDRDDRRLKVMVVDDDPELRRHMGRVLQGTCNCVLVEACQGYEAIELALRELPDLIFLDVAMPVLDGREALRILTSNPLTASIEVVMLTSLADPDEALLAREMGAVTLNKPVPVDILELIVERVFARLERPEPQLTLL